MSFFDDHPPTNSSFMERDDNPFESCYPQCNISNCKDNISIATSDEINCDATSHNYYEYDSTNQKSNEYKGHSDRYCAYNPYSSSSVKSSSQNQLPFIRSEAEKIDHRQETHDKVDHTYRDFSGVPPSEDDLKKYMKKKLEYEKRVKDTVKASSQSLDTIASSIEANHTQRRGLKKSDTFIGFMGTNFPARLHDLLSHEDEIIGVITWLPHGRSWKVLNKSTFLKEVAPSHFQISKFESFTRQVNGWGFKRITQGPDANSYYHEMFLRGMPHLIQWMKRISTNTTTSHVLGRRKMRADPKDEPNFYDISSRYPIPDYYKEINEQKTVELGEEEKHSDYVMSNIVHSGQNMKATKYTSKTSCKDKPFPLQEYQGSKSHSNHDKEVKRTYDADTKYDAIDFWTYEPTSTKETSPQREYYGIEEDIYPSRAFSYGDTYESSYDTSYQNHDLNRFGGNTLHHENVPHPLQYPPSRHNYGYIDSVERHNNDYENYQYSLYPSQPPPNWFQSSYDYDCRNYHNNNNNQNHHHPHHSERIYNHENNDHYSKLQYDIQYAASPGRESSHELRNNTMSPTISKPRYFDDSPDENSRYSSTWMSNYPRP